MTKKQTNMIPLVATAEEVKELQAIRDLRLAGRPYKEQKTAFFKRFRDKYGISTDSLIKIETDKPERLGIVQYVSNHAPVRIKDPNVQQQQEAQQQEDPGHGN